MDRDMIVRLALLLIFFFFQAEDGIRYHCVTGVQTCALPIYNRAPRPSRTPGRWRCMATWGARHSPHTAGAGDRPIRARRAGPGAAGSCSGWDRKGGGVGKRGDFGGGRIIKKKKKKRSVRPEW